jgi:hypothetical protein
MTKLSNYLENKLAYHVLRNTAYTPPTNLYIALHTADPTETGTVAETSFTGYARKALTLGAPSNGVSSNSADLTWSVGSTVTVTHVSIWDSLSAGNCLFYGPLTASKTMANGDTFKIVTGSLTVGFD